MWRVVERRAAVRESCDVCLVANLSPRDLHGLNHRLLTLSNSGRTRLVCDFTLQSWSLQVKYGSICLQTTFTTSFFLSFSIPAIERGGERGCNLGLKVSSGKEKHDVNFILWQYFPCLWFMVSVAHDYWKHQKM